MKPGIVTCGKFCAIGCEFAFKVDGWFTSTNRLSLDGSDADVDAQIASVRDGNVLCSLRRISPDERG